MGIGRSGRWKGESGYRHGEWGGRGSVDRHEWEGRRRVGIDRGSEVGGGREFG